MKKFLSLLKATTKGDLNIFKIKGKKNSKSGLFLIIFLSIMMLFCAYTYADIFAKPLAKVGLTYVVLTLFSLALVILNVMEGVYKSQGIIFDAKDNNLLFSLPIKKSYILTVRIIKLLAFDYIFEFLFMVPCIFRYAQLENPSFGFYPLSLLFLILLPFIPLIIGCAIGYLIKAFSAIFKKKKIMQTVISLILFFAIYAVIFNLEGFVNDIVGKATSINDMISKLYLPIGLYIDLIQKFDLLKLAELILISLAPFILFIMIFQHKYDSIINMSKEVGTSKSKKVSRITSIKSSSIVKALTIKELRTYVSIPIYIMNTIIGPILAIIFSIAIMIKYDAIIEALTSPETGLTIAQITPFLPYGIILVIMVLVAMTTVTSSAISLEGKKFSLLKSMPINVNDIFKSKMLLSDIILIPAMLISAVLYIIKLKIFNYNIIFILLAAVLFPHLNAQIGLLSNLKYPKLDFNSETEVVKQGVAVLVTMMICMILSAIPIFVFVYVSKIIGQTSTLILCFAVTFVLIFIADRLLKTYGVKRFNEIN